MAHALHCSPAAHLQDCKHFMTQAASPAAGRAGSKNQPCGDVPSSSMAPATFSSSSTASSRSSIFFTLLKHRFWGWRHGERWHGSWKHCLKHLQQIVNRPHALETAAGVALPAKLHVLLSGQKRPKPSQRQCCGGGWRCTPAESPERVGHPGAQHAAAKGSQGVVEQPQQGSPLRAVLAVAQHLQLPARQPEPPQQSRLSVSVNLQCVQPWASVDSRCQQHL